MFESLLLYLVLGAGAGLIAGLLGIGGGLIIVPALVWLWTAEGLGGSAVMHLALGTSLASIVLTGLSSARAHHRHAAIDRSLLLSMLPGLMIGAISGALLAKQLSLDALKSGFAVFELIVGIYMMLGAPRPRWGLTRAPQKGELIFAGTLIGSVSALMGIGGGSLSVPYLCGRGRSIRQAVALSAVAGVPIAFAGAVAYVVTGWSSAELPAGSLGYVYLPAFLGLVSASLLTAPLGARLTHRLPVAGLKRMFGGVLILLALLMFSA